MIALKNVLVATDFSEPSESALVYGRALARTFGATLHVVHVSRTFAYTMTGDVAAAGYTALMNDLDDGGAEGARSNGQGRRPSGARRQSRADDVDAPGAGNRAVRDDDERSTSSSWARTGAAHSRTS